MLLPLLLALSSSDASHDYPGDLIFEDGDCVDPDPYLAEVLRQMKLAEARELKTLDEVRPSLPKVPLSVDVQRASVRSVFRMLASTGDINIVLHDEVAGELSLKLVDVPWDQVLDVVLATHRLDAVAGENLIVVYPLGG